MLKTYFWNVFRGADRFINALTGGDPEMTISGRFGKAVIEGRCIFCKWTCVLLDKIDPNHCFKQASYEAGQGSDEIIKL